MLPLFPPDSPRGTARPVVPDPLPRRCSARSARSIPSGRTGARSRIGELPVHAVDESDGLEDDPPELVADPLDDGAEELPLSVLPLGTAVPVLSPFEGRDGSPCDGRSRSWAHTGARLRVNDAATSPIESF